MGPTSRSTRFTLRSGIAALTATLATAAAMAQAPRPRPRTAPRPQVPAARPTATATSAPTAVPTQARALAITHEEMGCVIVGKFPQFSACFEPATDLAAADMYFKGEKHTSWYRVPFKQEGKCHKATLPKPAKALKDTNVFLYASGASRQWGEARTREYAVKVVETEGECKGEKPVAPYVPSATITVFPSLPGGFAVTAAGGALPILPITGGALVVGGGVAVASGAFSEEGGTDNGGPDGGGASPTPTATPVTQVPTPTPTPRPSTNQPPNLSCRTSPNPPTGAAPLNVEFNLCLSEDPEGRPLTFTFEFGDGGTSGGFCRETHTYTGTGTFTAKACVQDELPANQRCCTVNVTTTVPTPVPYKAFAERMSVTSTLEVPGASAQVVMDDSQVAYPGEGTAYLVARARRGEIRFDAQLVAAKGQPGRWRFDFSQTEPMIPGTLRVVHGKVLQLKTDGVVFALQGKPGERVSFTFETWR